MTKHTSSEKLGMLDVSGTSSWISKDQLSKWESSSMKALDDLLKGAGPGNEFLGWLTLPEDSLKQLDRYLAAVSEFTQSLDTIVIIGIGGSYLGAKTVIEALSPHFGPKKGHPHILFAGHHLSESYLSDLLDHLNNCNWGIIVISKSGTTTEPAIAFRVLKGAIEKQFGAIESRQRIIAITDEKRGALRNLADEKGYSSFIIPDNVGGRYSVFSAVGIIPVLSAGFSAKKLLYGALDAMKATSPEVSFHDNPATLYAAVRNELYQQGKTTEILADMQPGLLYLGEWWKQLYGESEGKEHKGIFPASVTLTTDLHSLGQFIQEGPRDLFETFILADPAKTGLTLPHQDGDLDQLNYITGWSIDQVNKKAAEGTIQAHLQGGVPVIQFNMGPLDEYHLGKLLYVFEIACGISGYLLGVNPFDQPGVETYKNNMFRLLGKPGYLES